ncbi:MAG: hypothetical protein PVG40_16050, partial [Desulfobacterales bacterium]
MNIKRKWFTPIVMILALITMPLSNVSHADDRARDRKTLQGIQSIVVKVHSVEAEWRNELAKVGLSESALQTSIERQLQKAGIQVTSEESSSRSEFEGILNVRLNFVEPEPAMKKIPALDQEEETIETVDVKKRY